MHKHGVAIIERRKTYYIVVRRRFVCGTWMMRLSQIRRFYAMNRGDCIILKIKVVRSDLRGDP